ncbi:MAG: hypothetical protein JWQ80_2684 [Massilia sp.]|nr:hypothetical protein [Massilia sp.]
MAAATNTPGSGQDQGSTAIGGVTSGQAGATPTHETQAETGGSGGAQLTHSHGDSHDAGADKPGADHPAAPAGDTHSGVQSGARGALDTRPEQGGGTGTGIGSRESGANQSQDDLPPR